MYPAQRAAFDELLDEQLAAWPPSPERASALSLGRAIATRWLDHRAADGSSTTVDYVPRDQPGQWRRTPPRFRPPELPRWGQVRPFLVSDLAPFHPPGPPGLDSPDYERELLEVQSLGALTSTNRTAEQTLIAKFWSDFSYSSTPPGHCNEIARHLALERNLSLAETTRLFALLNGTLADAAILAWQAKYKFNFWRPVTAIARADEDARPATHPNPNWSSLLPCPPHPEYPSGHSVFSGAATRIFALFFESDTIPFTVGSDALPGVQRSFPSFSACAEEISLSRIYGGIHFRSACADGLAAGAQLADHIVAHFP